MDQVFNDDPGNTIIDYRGAPAQADRLAINAEYTAEVSPVRGLVHMHVFINIEHSIPGRGIRLDLPGIRALLAELAPGLVSYINVHAFSSEAAVRAYVLKGRTYTPSTLNKPIDSEAEIRRKVAAGQL